MTFETLVWAPTVLCLGFLGAGVLWGSRRRQDEGDEGGRRSAVRFARALTLFACIAAVYLTFETATSAPSVNILGLVFLLLGPVAGLAAFVVFLWNARGLERVLAPLAALFALGNTLLIAWIVTTFWR